MSSDSALGGGELLICRVESLARIMERMGCLDYARDRAVALEQYKVLGGYLNYPLALVFFETLTLFTEQRARPTSSSHMWNWTTCRETLVTLSWYLHGTPRHRPLTDMILWTGRAPT